MSKVDVGSDASLEAVRAVSRLLHGGNRYRIEIGAEIAARDLANTGELAAALGIAPQSVNQELHALERAGLLSRAPQDANRKVFFTRTDPSSSYWAWCEEVRAHARGMLERVSRY